MADGQEPDDQDLLRTFAQLSASASGQHAERTTELAALHSQLDCLESQIAGLQLSLATTGLQPQQQQQVLAVLGAAGPYLC